MPLNMVSNSLFRLRLVKCRRPSPCGFSQAMGKKDKGKDKKKPRRESSRETLEITGLSNFGLLFTVVLFL